MTPDVTNRQETVKDQPGPTQLQGQRYTTTNAASPRRPDNALGHNSPANFVFDNAQKGGQDDDFSVVDTWGLLWLKSMCAYKVDAAWRRLFCSELPEGPNSTTEIAVKNDSQDGQEDKRK